ncbi:hypothetical protein Hanom_Chr07g00667171 [Helianthus anomalus]
MVEDKSSWRRRIKVYLTIMSGYGLGAGVSLAVSLSSWIKVTLAYISPSPDSTNNLTIGVIILGWVLCIPPSRVLGKWVYGGASGTESRVEEGGKHAKACEDNHHAFVPLAFDTFGSLSSEAVRSLSRVKRVVHNNFSSPQGRFFVFSGLMFYIQKWMTTQFVAYLPAILM